MNVHQFLERPTKEAIRELPKFEGLPLQKICLVRTADDLFFVHDEISKVSHVGFDTEPLIAVFYGNKAVRWMGR